MMPALRPRLLILACSASKRSDDGLLSARKRYDGPLWRTLRAADPTGARATTLFFSAQYGLRTAAAPIPLYDARLTPHLARSIITEMNASAKADLGDEIVALVKAAGAPFADVAIVGGRLYLSVMQPHACLLQQKGVIDASARIIVINGSIGRMRAALRAWLLHT
jgi:hypothetical protein